MFTPNSLDTVLYSSTVLVFFYFFILARGDQLVKTTHRTLGYAHVLLPWLKLQMRGKGVSQQQQHHLLLSKLLLFNQPLHFFLSLFLLKHFCCFFPLLFVNFLSSLGSFFPLPATFLPVEFDLHLWKQLQKA